MAGLGLTPSEIRALPEHELIHLLDRVRLLDHRLQSELDSHSHAAAAPPAAAAPAAADGQHTSNQAPQQEQQPSELIAAMGQMRQRIDEYGARFRAREAQVRARRDLLDRLRQPLIPEGMRTSDQWRTLLTQPPLTLSPTPPPTTTSQPRQPVNPQGVSDYERWLAVFTQPPGTVPIPPPLGSNYLDIPVPSLVRRLETLSTSHIVEVNNVPTDHRPNPLSDGTEDVRLRIGRLGGLGHEIRLIQNLPPSRERVSTLAHKKILRAPSQGFYCQGQNQQAQWPNSFWTAPTWAGGPSSNQPDLSAVDVFMAPAEIEALPESEFLVPYPPPEFPFAILVDTLREFMHENEGIAMSFSLLGQKLSNCGFNCKRNLGIKTMKEMVWMARRSIGFGWTDPANPTASWIWLWDVDRPYRAPLCTEKQWEAFQASRKGWEPPGLKRGMVNVMRGGVGLVSDKGKKKNSAFWASLPRGEGYSRPPRANTAGPATTRWPDNDHRRHEVFAASVGPSTGRATRAPMDDHDDWRHVPDHSRGKGKKRMLDEHVVEEDDWFERRSRDLGREQDRERERRDRERERGPRHIDSDRDRDQSRDRDHDRDWNRDHDRNWGRSQERDRSHDRDRDHDRDRNRDRNRDHDRNWGRSQERDRSHDRDRDRDWIRDSSRDERGRYGPREEERNCRRGGNGSDSYPLEKRVRRD
ncbi:hypothetical protein CF336_g470 [Tilletia laevis]|nr:hypothetical protein CF336_g470 [Tilletia laevis]